MSTVKRAVFNAAMLGASVGVAYALLSEAWWRRVERRLFGRGVN